jgi:hypothetical protein
MFIAMAPILVPLAIWIYTLVFAFSSLWFSHYTLTALEQLRKQKAALAQEVPAPAAIELIANDTPVTAPPPPRLPPASGHTKPLS